jgi:hypothetical protein
VSEKYEIRRSPESRTRIPSGTEPRAVMRSNSPGPLPLRPASWRTFPALSNQ